MIAFLDASALIYLIEGQQPFADRVRMELAATVRRHPGVAVAISRLTWLECRIGPMKTNDNTMLATFDAFFSKPDLIWVELGKEVVELATAIRVASGLKTPDALQAASCLQLGPEHQFFTGDSAFRRVAGLNVSVLA